MNFSSHQKQTPLPLFSLSVLFVIDLRYFGDGIYSLDVSKGVGVEHVGRSLAYSGADLDAVRLLMLRLSEVHLLEEALGVILLGNNGVEI